MADEPLNVGIAKLVHSGDYILKFLEKGPGAIVEGGLREVLENNGCTVSEAKTAELTTKEQEQYGAWNTLGLASRHLADIVANQLRYGLFPIGLLANCNGLMGMLAGFQRSSANGKPLKVGLVWFDAHGDMNTPETTLSGLLAGMPVAIATGLCLERLRMKCGLEIALPTKHVTMVGVRDTDPLEQEIIDNSDVEHITAEEIKKLSPVINEQMKRLAQLTDLIYIHVHLDVLDPAELPGHGLTAEGGPASRELGTALEIMFKNHKAAGIGIAGYPSDNDPEHTTLDAIFYILKRVVKAVRNRNRQTNY